MKARSIPNYLGLFRILATPLLIWLILLRQPAADLWAVLLLLIIAGSDIADGPLARRMNVVSPLGIFLDTSS
ncbi:MAG TPA: CDP-alcohol phosphatidyltransferase family protein, partial [Herpetosiphonaceae bacterium]|nr:CDP-alcohol phosphatidyltransferase family protein [Herpetosiphonaceae bacterium]